MSENQTPQKRSRDEKTQDDPAGSDLDGSKRQKPYNNIISLLDDDEEDVEPSHGLSAILTTLQQELYSSVSPPAAAADDGDEGLKLAVMRHLLEASDDELGIPSRSTDEINSGEDFNLGLKDDGLWEFEDETANSCYSDL